MQDAISRQRGRAGLRLPAGTLILRFGTMVASLVLMLVSALWLWSADGRRDQIDAAMQMLVFSVFGYVCASAFNSWDLLVVLGKNGKA